MTYTTAKAAEKIGISAHPYVFTTKKACCLISDVMNTVTDVLPITICNGWAYCNA